MRPTTACTAARSRTRPGRAWEPPGGHGHPRPSAWVAHVGDSRCYRLRDGRLERLTHDHSLVDEQVRLGQLTQAQAETSPMRNVITRAVGTQDEVDADVIEFAVASGDLYLLASDGLMREVDDEQIAGILRASGGWKRPARKLIGAANRGREAGITSPACWRGHDKPIAIT